MGRFFLDRDRGLSRPAVNQSLRSLVGTVRPSYGLGVREDLLSARFNRISAGIEQKLQRVAVRNGLDRSAAARVALSSGLQNLATVADHSVS